MSDRLKLEFFVTFLLVMQIVMIATMYKNVFFFLEKAVDVQVVFVLRLDYAAEYKERTYFGPQSF